MQKAPTENPEVILFSLPVPEPLEDIAGREKEQALQDARQIKHLKSGN